MLAAGSEHIFIRNRSFFFLQFGVSRFTRQRRCGVKGKSCTYISGETPGKVKRYDEAISDELLSVRR